MKPKFFATPEKLRSWFEKNHQKQTEQWIGFYKKAATIRKIKPRKSITWPESVDQALCFGWIDGIRKSIDEESYMIRFTPRREKSTWSAVNLKRVPELIELNLMRPAGIAIYEKRDAKSNKQYAYERDVVTLPDAASKRLKQDKKAWKFFQSLTPSVKKPTIWWLVSAKKEETRKRRLTLLIECCKNQELIPQFRRPEKKKPKVTKKTSKKAAAQKSKKKTSRKKRR